MQGAVQFSQPVYFEVPLENPSSPQKGQLKDRFQITGNHSQITLESIEQKLNKAKELRQLEQSKKMPLASDVRLSRARDRRSNFVNEQSNKIRNALDCKMEVAIQKRSQLISTIVQKAQKETEKLDKASQLRQEREKCIQAK